MCTTMRRMRFKVTNLPLGFCWMLFLTLTFRWPNRRGTGSGLTIFHFVTKCCSFHHLAHKFLCTNFHSNNSFLNMVPFWQRDLYEVSSTSSSSGHLCRCNRRVTGELIGRPCLHGLVTNWILFKVFILQILIFQVAHSSSRWSWLIELVCSKANERLPDDRSCGDIVALFQIDLKGYSLEASSICLRVISSIICPAAEESSVQTKSQSFRGERSKRITCDRFVCDLVNSGQCAQYAPLVQCACPIAGLQVCTWPYLFYGFLLLQLF